MKTAPGHERHPESVPSRAADDKGDREKGMRPPLEIHGSGEIPGIGVSGRWDKSLSTGADGARARAHGTDVSRMKRTGPGERPKR